MPGDGKTPGDGTSSPFGDGGGGAGGGGMGQGNNFTTNPSGTPGAGGGGQPDSYMESKPQQAGGDPDINPAEIPQGGKDLFADPKPDTGNPIGTTAGSGGRKPFRVS